MSLSVCLMFYSQNVLKSDQIQHPTVIQLSHHLHLLNHSIYVSTGAHQRSTRGMGRSSRQLL